MKKDIRVVGKRITVRRLGLSDATSLAKNINNKDIAKWTENIPYPYKLSHALAYIRRSHPKINRGAGYPLFCEQRG